MSKRRLSKQQTQRLHQRSRGSASTRGAINEEELGPCKQGLVIAHQGKHVEVEDENGATLACHVRANIIATLGIVTGDKVQWQAVTVKPHGMKGDKHTSEQGVVTAIDDRDNLLVRVDNFGREKRIAANVDRMLITCAATPEPQLVLIDRYLVLAHELGVKASLVVNKTDLDTRPLAMLTNIYEPLGYTVLGTSSETAQGIDALQALLAQGTNIFVGQSGVGKSSLLQLLLPEQSLKVGAIAEGIGQGRHTTTQSRLYHLPSGGHCIDSPGIRELGLGLLQDKAIISAFHDVLVQAEHCQFRDCQHQQEPHCAVRAALSDGHLAPSRFSSYCQIQASQQAHRNPTK